MPFPVAPPSGRFFDDDDAELEEESVSLNDSSDLQDKSLDEYEAMAGMPDPSDVPSPLVAKENLPAETKKPRAHAAKKKAPPPISTKDYVVLVTIGDHSEGMRGFVAKENFVGPTLGEFMEVPSGHFEKFAVSATGTLILQNGQALSFGSIKIGHAPGDDVTEKI